MDSNQFYLFKDRRFLPIFIVQLCGCLNDNILKSALIMLISFKLVNTLTVDPYILVMLANVIFISPFVFFASLAGQVADRYERSDLVKIIKFIEIAIVILSTYGFYHTNLTILLTCIGLMGIHSTFFGPIKYSVLPDKLHKNELLGANGFIEAATFLSILIGTMMGGLYNFIPTFVVISSISVAIIGFIASLFMPKSNNSNSEIEINPNIVKETVQIVKYASSKNQVYLAILGISWFWFISAVILAQIPSLTRDILGADETVANLFLAIFSVGVGIGSFLCNKIFAHKITTKYIFLSALGLSICGIDLYFASKIASVSYQPEQLKNIFEFLSRIHYLRILVDLFGLAFIGGIYVVPLFAVMQYFSSPAYRSRIIAANNLINSVFIASSTLILSVLFYLNFAIPSIILIVSILNLIIAIHIYKIVPESKIIPLRLWRAIFRLGFHLAYRVELKGQENYKKIGKKTVIIANHLSHMDPALITAFLPENNIKFAINMQVAKEWWVKPFLKIVKTFPVEPNNPMAIKSLIEEVKKNTKIGIFPEGRTSMTGSLMKIYEGPGMIADKADATILPIRVDGTQFTRFAKVRKLMKSRFSFRKKITITILPPVRINPPAELGSKERRQYIGQFLYDIMSDMVFESSNYKQTIFQSLIDASKTHGSKSLVIEDIDNNSETYRGIFLKSFALSAILKTQSKPGEHLGLMLPSMAGSMVVFFAMQAIGRTPAMINFTSGSANVISSCRAANVKKIYTSRIFIKKAELVDLVGIVEKDGIKFVYLEDMRKEITPIVKIKSLIASVIPQSYYNNISEDNSDLDRAVILFTSGTEGKPKAVALSHRNIQANINQAIARLDFNPYDRVLNILPLFHSFGLTTSLMMCLNGVKTFFYPSPLHYKIIPELVYDISATILFGTDTFLTGYAHHAHPYDFYTLRYVIAGAEKLKPRTRKAWFDKFGVRIFEGYGVTEASPVIAVNTPMHDKPGTVGRLLPNIEYFLQPVEGVKEGGKLCVKGPNIMQGYLNPDKPGEIIEVATENLGKGWYDTGDIASIDDDGYLTIIGRQKRFAKIGGEMVSLALVEDLANNAQQLIDKENAEKANSPSSIGSISNAVISISDDKKGEVIVLFTTYKAIDRKAMIDACKKMGVSDLHIPKIINNIKEIPILTTGKIDYRTITKLAQE